MTASTHRDLSKLAALIVTFFVLLAACGGSGGGGGAGKKKIAFVPKLIGIPYFDAMQKGGAQAANDLGVEFLYQGPSTADSAKQIEVIDSLITRHVDAIAVAPDDPAAIAPILQKAKNAGIKVFTSDTDAPDTVRQVWVNQALSDEIGNSITDALASQMGGSGKWAIVSCGPTAQNLKAFADAETKRASSKYPGMQQLGIKFAGEDQQQAVVVAKDLMTANPDLKGLVGQCTTSAPGVAQAITEMNKIGKVFGTGLGTPTVMAPFIKSGAEAKVVLWDPVKLGYLTVWAGLQLADGKSFQNDNEVSGGVGKVKYMGDQKMLLLGPPITFSKDNIDQYAGKF